MIRNELIRELTVYVIFAAILYFFYKAIWAFILLVPMCLIYHRYNKKAHLRKRRNLLGSQFKDALCSITAALRAGYSVENALTESYKEMLSLYGGASPIAASLRQVLNEISLGVNTESALEHFARKSQVEDIKLFSSVFSIAKRSGGDLVEILKKTSDDISAKIDTRNEISVVISSKKLEQNIMSFMPLGILVYIGISSPDMLSPLYGNLLGIAVMTVCLLIYAFAYYISLKIIDIEV